VSYTQGMADASLEAPAEGGGAPQAGGSNPPLQENPAMAGRPEDYVEVKAEKDRATLMIRGSAAKDAVTLTREVVAQKLAGLKVTTGVDWKAVDTALSAHLYDKTLIIAAGTPPGQSKDAWIEEKIKIDPDVKPVVAQDGHADYKNVDNIHQVKKGDVLAVKHPAVQGEPGMDIYGKAAPAAPAKDQAFKLGANTELSLDGLQLLASTGGYVFHQAGAIHVGVTYTVKGDVDFHTGNLHYQGDIVILGNVTDGFTVEAQGDVTVEGNVDGAEIISHGGTVTLKAAAFGHGKGLIRAGKAVRVQSVQDMRIECDGEVEVGKGMLNCKVTASILRADAAGCAVVGGEIKAYQEARIAVLGGEGCRTDVRIVDKEAEAARARLVEIDKKVKAAQPKMEPLEMKLKGMQALAKRAGSLSPRAVGELKTALDAYAQMKKALDSLEAERKVAAAATNSHARHTGRFLLTEKVVWGGCLEMYGHPRDLQAGDEGKEWVWSADGLQGRTILPDPPAAPAAGQPPPPADPPA
jgi:uncharacterized protein (DUF342 family)